MPRSGKTSLFSALVGEPLKKEEHTHQRCVSHPGTIKLEDVRLRHLAEVFGSKKITFSDILLLDLMLRGESDTVWFEAAAFREAECLVGILRCFAREASSPSPDKIDPLQETRNIEAELILADLALIQARIKKIEEDIKKGRKEEERDLTLLKRIEQHLAQELPLRRFALEPQEEKLLRGFQFLSQKPLFFVFNLDEGGSFEDIERVKKELTLQDYRFITASLKIEAELRELEPAEQIAFLETLGFKEPLKDRFILACLNFLDLVTFFTVKGEESRAWLVDKNTPALKAAGKIHSDIERGFIRAEVINYNDFVNAGSSLSEARKKGLVRLESKEYIVRDGDIIDFRFAV